MKFCLSGGLSNPHYFFKFFKKQAFIFSNRFKSAIIQPKTKLRLKGTPISISRQFDSISRFFIHFQQIEIKYLFLKCCFCLSGGLFLFRRKQVTKTSIKHVFFLLNLCINDKLRLKGTPKNGGFVKITAIIQHN